MKCSKLKIGCLTKKKKKKNKQGKNYVNSVNLFKTKTKYCNS